MIETLNLQKRFGKRDVLKGVNLTIRPGAITGLAGPNASGKTTLIKCILGLVVPDLGSIKIDGQQVDSRGEFRRKIGYLPQNPSFPNNLNLFELTHMLEDLRREKAVLKDEIMTLFDLNKVSKQPFGELSGGTKQKIAIVIALMFNTQLLICDEPTAGLDPVSGVVFKELLIEQAKRGKTIVFVSHQLMEIQQLASDVVFMNEGTVLFSGSSEQLCKTTGAVDLERATAALYASLQRKQT